MSGERRPGLLRLAGWGVPLSLTAMAAVAVFCVVVTSAAVVVVTVGIPLTLLSVPWLRSITDWHRLWVTRTLGVPVARPYRPLPERGRLARVRAMLTDPATWRDLRWVLVNGTAGVFLVLLPITFAGGVVWFAVAMPVLVGLLPARPGNDVSGLHLTTLGSAIPVGVLLGVACALLFRFTTRPLFRAYARLVRWGLGPPEKTRLADRIAQLTESRAETVDTQAAELRRIERDLHDGAQARRVSLGMSLGMAEHLLASDPDAAGELLAEAREATGLALAELRDLVRGIHPPVLADRVAQLTESRAETVDTQAAE
ncbi:MAG TPA: sensor domain-containing protein, partial [Pseudonocardiaceae bacterium]|nr:sensor domain-containing protein [Pseudonocardiaceae bacterium]